ncbi:MAG: hypothetical protein MZU95_12450 [Desulfomicrobium escambiense]|nr:hypothetical protein [Desulfomicrobium escambiense]
MIHLALNAFHGKWEHFFSNLRFVVIGDDPHLPRHLRVQCSCACPCRLARRICRYWGSSPQFIACSATRSQTWENSAETLHGPSLQGHHRQGGDRPGRDGISSLSRRRTAHTLRRHGSSCPP